MGGLDLPPGYPAKLTKTGGFWFSARFSYFLRVGNGWFCRSRPIFGVLGTFIMSHIPRGICDMMKVPKTPKIGRERQNHPFPTRKK
jgi:hypothetical protein